jgi:type II secretory pathway component PulF
MERIEGRIADLTRFTQDLTAVALANAPLQLDSAPKIASRRRLLKQLKTYQRQLSALEPAAANSLPPIPRRLASAWEVFSVSGKMELVLEGLTARGIAQQRLRKLIRWPSLYVFLLLCMSGIGMFFYGYFVLPLMGSFRADARSRFEVQGWDFQTWFPILFYSIASISAIFMALLLTGGLYRLLLRLGGRRYLDLTSSVVAQRSIPVLLAKGVDKEKAVDLCCALSDVDATAREIYFPQQISEDPAVWLQTAEYWMLAAEQHYMRLKFTFPILVVACVGGTLAMLYGVGLYGPVVAMLKDLSLVGAGAGG